ncbi:MAG: O-antigen ligase family protein [Leptolyngbyaceae cyanobacterium bins.59]|nr:O-antigen ligase family protein [Leptolyngbyaceae cyanobacterium bins.59]
MKSLPPLGILTALFYILFTLLPDSNTVMVSWPWVFLWQGGLACAGLWLLWQIGIERQWHRLGHHLDWLMVVGIAGLLLSTLTAEFPQQARWYTWATLCFLAALYALNTWLQIRERRSWLLIAQGYLGLAFILTSLGLWIGQTLIPEQIRLQGLRNLGLSIPWLFAPEARNWAPVGHSNYVAGYLLLLLPLLAGLARIQPGWRRWVWGGGTVLGIVDLYTTSSRMGWLVLAIVGVIGLISLLWQRQVSRRIWGGAGIAVLLFLVGLVTNERVGIALASLFRGQAPDTYRAVTIATAFNLFRDRPWLGVGLGGVPLLFQRDRPFWAGREAEWTYQLHSTPAQILAELGVWGILLMLGLGVLLGMMAWRWRRSHWAGSSAEKDIPIEMQNSSSLFLNEIPIGPLFAGLLGYGLFSLTDYQLDNVCISGLLVIYLAVLASELRSSDEITPLPRKWAIGWAGAGLGLSAIVGLWLFPIHLAWNLSSQGFSALKQNDLAGFTRSLERAYELAPWEPYYPYQSGWNLGNLGLGIEEPADRQRLQELAIPWFQQGNQVAPYQEFGRSNLGWLLLSLEPDRAMTEFEQAARLVPAKRGVFYGLGISLLLQGAGKPAIQALTLEVLRDPLFLTSPLWQSAPLNRLYPFVLTELETQYSEFLKQPALSNALKNYLHQVRGGLRWWQGDLVSARQDWEKYGLDLGRWVLALSEEGRGVNPQKDRTPIPTPGDWALLAWANPDRRSEFLKRAWAQGDQKLPAPEMVEILVNSMNQAPNLNQWIKQSGVFRELRRERLGFGTISRHIDGPIPQDFMVVIENGVMEKLFPELLPSPDSNPELDRLLQPKRDRLLQTINAIGRKPA